MDIMYWRVGHVTALAGITSFTPPPDIKCSRDSLIYHGAYLIPPGGWGGVYIIRGGDYPRMNRLAASGCIEAYLQKIAKDLTQHCDMTYRARHAMFKAICNPKLRSAKVLDP